MLFQQRGQISHIPLERGHSLRMFIREFRNFFCVFRSGLQEIAFRPSQRRRQAVEFAAFGKNHSNEKDVCYADRA